MLARRIQGVMKQYGPLVAFFTVDLLMGNEHYVRFDGRTAVVRLDRELTWIGMDEAPVEERVARLLRDYLEHRDWFVAYGGDSAPVPRASATETDTLVFDRYDRLVPWVALQISRWLDGMNIPLEELGPVTEIADWANAMRPNLMSMSIVEAADLCQEWHDEMGRRATMQKATPGKVVFTFEDGWTFQKLTTREQLAAEGASQGICVGQESYVLPVEHGEMSIYSLRDAEGVPHVTVEVDADRVAHQIKGRGNARIERPALCLRLEDAFRAVGIYPDGDDWSACFLLYRARIDAFRHAHGRPA